MAWTCFTNVKGWQDIVICLLSSMKVLAHSNTSKTLHKLNTTLNGTWIHDISKQRPSEAQYRVTKEGVTWHDFPTHSAALAYSSFWNTPLTNTPLSNVLSSKQQLLDHSTIKHSLLLTPRFGSLHYPACCQQILCHSIIRFCSVNTIPSATPLSNVLPC